MLLSWWLLCNLTAFSVLWCVSCVDLPEFPPLSINPDILPKDSNIRTFADIRIGGGLVDWQPYDLDSARRAFTANRQVLIVKGNDGTDHECFLPLTDKHATVTDEVLSINTDTPSYLTQLQKKIERLKTTCLQLQGGYWAYEVCPMRYVRQFHREIKKTSLAAKIMDSGNSRAALGNALGDVLQAVLGRAEQEIISEDYLLGRYVPDMSSDRLVDGHFVQTYVDGDYCAEAGGIVRQAEVRYECSLAKAIDHIIDVTEVSSCRYSVRIGTSKVCSSSVTLPDSKRSIKCYPLESQTKPKTTVFVTDEESVTTQYQAKATTRSKKQPLEEGKDQTFWKQRLRHFLAHDGEEYPIIHKILHEFMESEHMALPDAEEDLPDRLVKKWLALLGIDEKQPKQSVNDQSTSNNNAKENNRDQKKRDKSAKKEESLVLQFEL